MRSLRRPKTRITCAHPFAIKPLSLAQDGAFRYIAYVTHSRLNCAKTTAKKPSHHLPRRSFVTKELVANSVIYFAFLRKTKWRPIVTYGELAQNLHFAHFRRKPQPMTPSGWRFDIRTAFSALLVKFSLFYLLSPFLHHSLHPLLYYCPVL